MEKQELTQVWDPKVFWVPLLDAPDLSSTGGEFPQEEALRKESAGLGAVPAGGHAELKGPRPKCRAIQVAEENKRTSFKVPSHMSPF